MLVWSFLTQVITPCLITHYITKTAFWSHSSIAQHYTTQFLGCCWINKMPIETNPFWCVSVCRNTWRCYPVVSALHINNESSSIMVSIWMMLILGTPIVNSDMSSFLRTLFSNQNPSNLCHISQSVPLFSLMCWKIWSSVWNICCSWRRLNVKCHLKYHHTWWQQFQWKLWYKIQIYLINLKEMGICRLWKCSFPHSLSQNFTKLYPSSVTFEGIQNYRM